MPLTRRSVLASGTSAMASPLFANPLFAGTVDVIVIGAGAAGIATARDLVARGYTVQVIEADTRVGGRVFSQTQTFGVPYDVGAHWLHYAEENPFVAYGQQNGFDLYKAPDDDVHYVGNRLATKDEYNARADAIDTATRAMLAAGRNRKDVSAASVVPDLGEWGRTTSMFTGAYEMAKDPSDFSCADWYSSEDGTDWYCTESFGALFAHSARDVPVSLNVKAQKIRWKGQGVRVETDQGTLSAQAVVVTVSTGVLASGDIAFDPPLPADTQDAFGALKMGHYHHVALQLRDNFFGIGKDGYFGYQITQGTLETPVGFAALVDACGHGLTYCDIGGSFAKEMSDAGTQAMRAFVVDELKNIFGSDVEKAIVKSDTFDWTKHDLTQGAYASAEPGGAGARRALRRVVGDRIWFAGEATSKDDWATVAGAHKSGIAAAKRIARKITPA